MTAGKSEQMLQHQLLVFGGLRERFIHERWKSFWQIKQLHVESLVFSKHDCPLHFFAVGFFWSLPLLWQGCSEFAASKALSVEIKSSLGVDVANFGGAFSAATYL